MQISQQDYSSIMIDDSRSYDSFIFTHIPKCGGTSFRSFLNVSAKKSGVPRQKRYIPGFNWLSVEKDYHRLDRVRQERFHNKTYKVVAMHVEYGWHYAAASYMKNPFYYTLLRRPLDRVLSHYQFFNKGKGRRNVKGIDIQNLSGVKLDEVLSTSANLSIIYVLGKGINGGVVSSMMKDDALDNLINKYHDFGILDEPTISISSLKEKWPIWFQSNIPFEHRNKSHNSAGKKPLSEFIKEKIIEHNQLEIEFYNQALDLFKQRCVEEE
jgi:hypothetical protein